MFKVLQNMLIWNSAFKKLDKIKSFWKTIVLKLRDYLNT